MTYEEAFLQTILETPADDTPRLIFADWLEEQGQEARAEFIRVQCALAKWPDAEHCPICGLHWKWRVDVEGQAECEKGHSWTVRHWRDLRYRNVNLLADHEQRWAAEALGGWHKPAISNRTGNIVCDWEFTRGFISRVKIWTTKAVIFLEMLGRRCPLEHVEIAAGDMAEGIALPFGEEFVRRNFWVETSFVPVEARTMYPAESRAEIENRVLSFLSYRYPRITFALCYP